MKKATIDRRKREGLIRDARRREIIARAKWLEEHPQKVNVEYIKTDITPQTVRAEAYIDYIMLANIPTSEQKIYIEQVERHLIGMLADELKKSGYVEMEQTDEALSGLKRKYVAHLRVIPPKKEENNTVIFMPNTKEDW